MTFEPPPAPPPPGSSFDPRAVNPLDWGILGSGALAFIFSFVDFYTARVDAFGTCFGYAGAVFGTASAWHGFFGWFAVVLAVAGSAAVAAEIFPFRFDLPAPARLLGLGAYGMAALSILLALFITPGGRLHERLGGCRITVGVGHGIGYCLTLAVIAAGLVLCYLRFQHTGGRLPGRIAGEGSPQP